MEFEDQLSDALHDVSVPSSLRDRISARLHSEVREPSPATAGVQLDHAARYTPKHATPDHGVSDHGVSRHSVSRYSTSRYGSRRLWMGLAAAAAVAGIGLAIIPFTASRTSNQLATRCLDLLDSIDSVQPERWDAPAPDDLEQTRLALRQMQTRQTAMQLVGRQQVDRWTIWRLQSEVSGSIVYLIETNDQSPLADLTQSFALLRDSGKWTLAGMQVDQRVFFLASQDDVMRFVRTVSIA